MTDPARFEDDFASWARDASLPALVTALEILAAECLFRGERAKEYMARHFFDAAATISNPGGRAP